MGSKEVIGAEGAEDDEGAEGAEGFVGAEEDEGFGGAEGDEGAAICILLDGQDTTGIAYMALWGFRAKCWSGVGEWSGWMDTP